MILHQFQGDLPLPTSLASLQSGTFCWQWVSLKIELSGALAQVTPALLDGKNPNKKEVKYPNFPTFVRVICLKNYSRDNLVDYSTSQRKRGCNSEPFLVSTFCFKHLTGCFAMFFVFGIVCLLVRQELTWFDCRDATYTGTDPPQKCEGMESVSANKLSNKSLKFYSMQI